MGVTVLVRIAIAEGEIAYRLRGEELLHIGRVARIEQPKGCGTAECSVAVLHESGGAREARRDAGRIGDYPVGVIEEKNHV